MGPAFRAARCHWLTYLLGLSLFFIYFDRNSGVLAKNRLRTIKMSADGVDLQKMSDIWRSKWSQGSVGEVKVTSGSSQELSVQHSAHIKFLRVFLALLGLSSALRVTTSHARYRHSSDDDPEHYSVATDAEVQYFWICRTMRGTFSQSSGTDPSEYIPGYTNDREVTARRWEEYDPFENKLNLDNPEALADRFLMGEGLPETGKRGRIPVRRETTPRAPNDSFLHRIYTLDIPLVMKAQTSPGPHSVTAKTVTTQYLDANYNFSHPIQGLRNEDSNIDPGSVPPPPWVLRPTKNALESLKAWTNSTEEGSQAEIGGGVWIDTESQRLGRLVDPFKRSTNSEGSEVSDTEEASSSPDQIKKPRIIVEEQLSTAEKRFRRYFRYLRTFPILLKSLGTTHAPYSVVSHFIAQQHAYDARLDPKRRIDTVMLMRRFPELSHARTIVMLKRLYQLLDLHLKEQAAPLKNFDKRWIVESIATIKVVSNIYDFTACEEERRRYREQQTERHTFIGPTQSSQSEGVGTVGLFSPSEE
ncbi:hypothetical protein AAMO2058_001642600 [Amorphochlora amoebiformis]